MMDVDFNDIGENGKTWHPGIQVLILAVGFISHFAQGWGFDEWYNFLFKILALSSTFFLCIVNFKKAIDVVNDWVQKAINFFR